MPPGRQSRSAGRRDPFDRPLDALLERMRWHSLEYRPHPGHVDRWVADCPVCDAQWPALELVEHPSVARPLLAEEFVGGPVSAICMNGCHESRIIAALAATPKQAQGKDASRQAAA